MEATLKAMMPRIVHNDWTSVEDIEPLVFLLPSVEPIEKGEQK